MLCTFLPSIPGRVRDADLGIKTPPGRCKVVGPPGARVRRLSMQIACLNSAMASASHGRNMALAKPFSYCVGRGRHARGSTGSRPDAPRTTRVRRRGRGAAHVRRARVGVFAIKFSEYSGMYYMLQHSVFIIFSLGVIIRGGSGGACDCVCVSVASYARPRSVRPARVPAWPGGK